MGKEAIMGEVGPRTLNAELHASMVVRRSSDGSSDMWHMP